MTDDTNTPQERGPTVILIGGRMTVDDGSTLDSRQPIVGDPGSQVTRRSLATSLLWWTTASALVSRILDDSGPHAFALVIGARSVVEVRGDGELRRTRLQSFLPGDWTTADFIRCIGEPLPDGYRAMGEESHDRWRGPARRRRVKIVYGYQFTNGGQRWVFVNQGEYYMSLAAAQFEPSVIVDTSWPTEAEQKGDSYAPYAERFRRLERGRLFDRGIVLVMPHTYRTETFFRKYASWVHAGRPDDDPSRWQPPPPSAWDATAPPDPIRYSCPVPIQAEFGVTGFIRDGDWQDPSDLEAARSLLQARYDLKIGIWDLVNNATLRSTLLETSPFPEAPGRDMEVPIGAAGRAQHRVAKRMEAHAEEATARRRIEPQLQSLREVGWQKTPRSGLYLPLTELIPLSTIRRAQDWPDDQPFPLVELEFTIGKRYCEVSAFTIMYNQVDLRAYARSRQKLLEQVAAPEICMLAGTGRVSLWRNVGGWGDGIDWRVVAAGIARRSPPWKEAFDALCKECRGLLAQ